MHDGKTCTLDANGTCAGIFCKKPNVQYVEDEEFVLRIFLHPKHYDLHSKTIKPEAFSRNEFFDKGFSVDRQILVRSLEDYKKIIDNYLRGQAKREKNKGKDVPALGCICRLNAKDVRSTCDDIFFCPSSSEKRLSHADIRSNPEPYAEWNEIRESLSNICDLCSVEDFFEQD